MDIADRIESGCVKFGREGIHVKIVRTEGEKYAKLYLEID